MLLPYTTLVYYGPGAAAMVADAPVIESTIQPRMDKRFGLSGGGVGEAITLRPFRGRAFGLSADGVGTMTSQSRKRQRFGLAVSIGGALTQDAVTGAVLESKVEGDLTLKQAIRILLAHASGSATGLEGASPAFLSQDGTKTRIAGTYAGGNRTVTTLDGS